MEPTLFIPTVWAVDDNIHNLELLQKILHRSNFEVLTFDKGEKMLKGLTRVRPDFVLLDIDMPGLSGYQVCEKMKSTPETAAIPVIFISALDDIVDKKEGFRLGGVDYITKPFNAEEVVMRINNHLLISVLQNRLARQNQNLEIQVKQRTAELEQANRRLKMLDDLKSDFLQFISHELRTPLNGLLGVVDLLVDELGEEIDADLINMFEHSRRRTINLVDDTLLLNELEASPESSQANPVVLKDLLGLAIQSATAGETNLEIELNDNLTSDDKLIGDIDLLVKAFSYLLATIHQFCSPENPVVINISPLDSAIEVKMVAQGKKITKMNVDAFFNFYSSERSYSYAESKGLAPIVASKILALYGGTVALSRGCSDNAVFTVRLATVPSSQR